MRWPLGSVILTRENMMIDQIRGKISKKYLSHLVLLAGNIGYRINMSTNSIQSMPKTGEEITILTHLHVREDLLDLYGFIDVEEKNTFHLLISISGVGPKLALTILSGVEPKDLKLSIINGDIKALTRIPGVGMKTAKRMIVELKEKFVGNQDSSIEFMDYDKSQSAIFEDAVNALVLLGYKKNHVEGVCVELEKKGDLGSDLELVIKKALKLLTSK